MKYFGTLLRSLIVIVSLALLLSSCGAPSRLALEPVASRTRWLMGKNFSIASDSLAVVSVAFERDAGYRLHFDVEIVNLSADTILISPEQIVYTVALDSTLTRWKDSAIAALDPEPKLRALVSGRESEDSDYGSHLNGRNVDAVVNGVVTIVNVVTDGDRKSGEKKAKEDSARAAQRAEELAGYLKRDQEHEETVMYLNGLEREWGPALRRTSLATREAIRGRIIFTPVRDAAGMRLAVPVGSRIYTFVFRQRQEER